MRSQREGRKILVVAVCDDDNLDRTIVCKTVETYLRNHGLDGKIFSFDSAEKLYSALEGKKLKFDIVLMDIILGDMDGLSCARLIRRQDKLARIIFLTSSADYVYDGYEVNATAYLLKPVGAEKLAAVLDKTIAQIEDVAKESLAITSGGMTRKILLEDILYAESQKNRVIIVLTHGERLAVYSSLDSFEQEHRSEMLIRSHKSYIVNFIYIEQYAGEKFVLRDGTVIPISRIYKDRAKESFFTLLHKQ